MKTQMIGSRDEPRPWWMTLLSVVCLLAVASGIVRDLFIPESRWVEVWFGFEVTGPLALATAPIHWGIFALGAWAFWTARPWIAPCAAGYLFYAALAHLVWSEASPHGRGWRVGVVQATVFAGLALLVLLAHRHRAVRLPSGSADR